MAPPQSREGHAPYNNQCIGGKRDVLARAIMRNRKKQKQQVSVVASADTISTVNPLCYVLELGEALVWDYLPFSDICSLFQVCSGELSQDFADTSALKILDKFAVENNIHLGLGCACDWMRNLDFIPHRDEHCTVVEPVGVSKATLMLRTSRGYWDFLEALALTKKLMQPFWSINERHKFFVSIVHPLATEKDPKPTRKAEITRAMEAICKGAGTRFFYKFKAKRRLSGVDFLDRHWDAISAGSCSYCDKFGVDEWNYSTRQSNRDTRIRAVCKKVYQPLKAAMEESLQHVRFVPMPRGSRMMSKYRSRYRFEGLVGGVTNNGVFCGLYLVNGYSPTRDLET